MDHVKFNVVTAHRVTAHFLLKLCSSLHIGKGRCHSCRLKWLSLKNKWLPVALFLHIAVSKNTSVDNPWLSIPVMVWQSEISLVQIFFRIAVKCSILLLIVVLHSNNIINPQTRLLILNVLMYKSKKKLLTDTIILMK